MRPLHVALLGYYGFENTGDEALLSVLLKYFKEKHPSVSVTVLSKRTNFVAVFSTLRKTRLLVLGGGSLLQNATSSFSLYFYLAYIFLAKLLGNSVILLAQGIGPIRGRWNQRLAGRVLSLAERITLRDTDSLSLAIRLGVPAHKMEMTADLAYLLEPDDAVAEKLSAQKYIGIVPRDFSAFPMASIVDRLRRWVHDTRGECVFLPFQPSDVGICETIINQGIAGKIMIGLTPPQMLAVISKMDCVLSVRLHGLILAKLAGVRVEGIVYDPKVQSFLDDPRDLETLKERAKRNLEILSDALQKYAR